MTVRLNGDALRWLDALNREGSLARMSDGQLLQAFLARDGSTSEPAFEVLVRRHGPMVLGICRGVLRDDHDSDDAFQATFLVLARRASTIRDRERLAHWLGRVAGRIARRSREEAVRRAARERQAIASESASAVCLEPETASLVRDEVDRLPEADRLLLQLTYWQGKTYEEAAALLSWPIGTVRSRLSRARDRLRHRLAHLGLASLAVPPGSSRLATHALAAPVPEALVLRTVRTAARVASGMTAAVESGVVPAAVAALANGELSTMATIPWKSIAALLFLGGTLTGVVAARVRPSPDAVKAEPMTPVVAPALAPPMARSEPQAKPQAKPLLANGGIEKGDSDSPESWSQGAEVPGVTYSWSRVAHSGKGSLCLKKSVQRYFPIAQWSQKVGHRGDAARLRVSAWVKANQATKAILDAQFVDGSNKWSHAWVAYIGAKEANDPPVTHGWKKYEGVVEIPKGTKSIVIAPQIYGPGTVWFDDLDAEYTEDPKTDPIAS
jgi:RNA polymerase sigma-70 factor (ECF subfamily)